MQRFVRIVLSLITFGVAAFATPTPVPVPA
jgi:hypothetical protein